MNSGRAPIGLATLTGGNHAAAWATVRASVIGLVCVVLLFPI